MSREKNKQGAAAFSKSRQSHGALPALPIRDLDSKEGYPKNKSFVFQIAELVYTINRDHRISGQVMEGDAMHDQKVFWFDKEGRIQSGRINQIVAATHLVNLPEQGEHLAIIVGDSTTSEMPAYGYIWTP